MTSLKTINLAVFEDSAPLVRTVRWRTVAKTLGGSQMIPMLGGEIVERQQGILIFGQAVDRLGVFRIIFLDEDGNRRLG